MPMTTLEINRLRQLLDSFINDRVLANPDDDSPELQAAETLAQYLGEGRDDDTDELPV